MSTVVNNPYKKYLEHTHSFVYRKLNGSDFFGMGNELQLKKISADITFFPFIINECKFKMFVVDASYDKSEPSDGYHITFIERSKREYVLFSQTYNKNKFFLNIYSLNSGKILQAFQNLDVNELWKSTGLFRDYSGKQLFLLNNTELKQIIDNLINFQTNCHEWNLNIFDKLHIAYMIHINNKDLTTSVLKYLHDKKSTLFEFYNLLYKFKIIEKNSEKDGTVIRKIRAWRQLLNASGCKQIKIYKNNEYWTKAEDTAADLETLDLFTETDLNLQPELDSDLYVKIFWKCFEDAMSSNIKGDDGQRRILSIIAEKFSYSKLNEKLKVSNNLINAARIHARLYGSGGSILEEDHVKMTRKKLSDEQLRDLETFLHDK
ncbi:9665_t:CDS:1, partial [Entrophospora sp. SA101]